jgi:CRISPR-associated protein Cas1
MTTVYIDQRGARLGYVNRALEIRLPDDSLRRVPLGQLGRLVVGSEAEISVGLLRQLADARVPMIVLRGRSRADAAMLWPNAGDAARRLAQRRVADDPALSLRLARVLVRARLRSEVRLLMRLRDAHPRARYAISRAARLIAGIRRGLDRHANVDAMRGAEGAAARLYFAAYARLLPAGLGFSSRNRRPPRDPVNAALSLGYALLHGRALEVVHAAALDAGIGVLHALSHNRPSLSCDLMETERHVIEALVQQLFAQKRLKAGDFETLADGCRLTKTGRTPFYAALEPELEAARRRMQRRVHALLRWLDQNAPPTVATEDPDDDA